MLETSSALEIPAAFGDIAVAIGKFDGIHIGHARLISELVTFSKARGLMPAVLTFDRHPNATLNPEAVPGRLIGSGQKSALIKQLGVELLVTLEFDSELASLSPESFIRRVLLPMHSTTVFVGQAFKFGTGGSGNAATLRHFGAQLGFDLHEVMSVEFGGSKVSSTRIRSELDLGNVRTVADLLGRNHSVVGEIEHGRKLGRTLGFPTANFSRLSEGYLPVDGIYAGYLTADGVRYPAAHSVGINDSIAEVPRLLESHVIGRDDLDLYGKVCVAEFVDQVRPWSKFSSLEVLIDQIGKDVAVASRLLQG